MNTPYKRRGEATAITFNGPNLVVIAGLAGYSAGLEYRRFLEARGRFAVSVPLYAFHAGTFSLGGRDGLPRTKINGFFAAPGVAYHPVGNRYRSRHRSWPRNRDRITRLHSRRRRVWSGAAL